MTREELSSACLSALDTNKCVIAELSTGTGKTKIAIDCINKIHDQVLFTKQREISVLIVVDRLVHVQNWQAEFDKWGMKATNVTFICYASLHKHKNSRWDVICLDEIHHVFSEKRMEALRSMHINNNMLGLSATISKEAKKWLKSRYKTSIISCSLQDAIDSSILPDPEIILMPLDLDNTIPDQIVEINKSAYQTPITDTYVNKWFYRRNGKYAKLTCTKRQKLEDINGLVDWYKKKVQSGNKRFKTMWLKTCSDRLKFLAECKNDVVLAILKKLKNKRTLTFCASIGQSDYLGKHCIHSKNKLAQGTLDSFNNKKIKHLTACMMLNEGINLAECEYGIFANINASEGIKIQRVGRLLRHKHPKIIIPFYKNSREAQIVTEWMKGYNPDLIKSITLDELLS